MIRGLSAVVLTAASLQVQPVVAGTPVKPIATRPGTCVFTTVRRVGQRLEANRRPVAGSGSWVILANGLVSVSYDQVDAVDQSRPGDRVMTCLARLPRHCPPGDNRGKWYVTTNMRTNLAWMLPDSPHSCGGA